MAQIIHDISTPNDGLGDPLREGFDHQNTMNTELYTTKVDKVVGKELSSNDYDNDAVTKLDGIEAGAEVNVQSDWLQSDDTQDDYVKNKPTELFTSVGYFDYNDVATQTTPLTYTSGVELQLTNDTLGTLTDRTQAPYNVSNTWDETTNTFDFSELSIGDTLDLRIDLTLTTAGANAIVKCFLRIGEGTASEYDVFIGSEYFKTAASNDNVKLGLEFYIGSENVRTVPAKLILISDTNGSVKVNGWYNRIIRKGINIVDINDNLLVRKNFFSGYAYNTTGAAIVSPLRPEGQGNYVYTDAGLISVDGFDTTLLTDLGVIYEGKELIIQNQTGVNITLLNNGTAELPFIFNNGLDLVIPTGEKIKFQYSGGFFIELFKSWSSGGGGGTSNLVWSYNSSNLSTVIGTTSISIIDYVELPAEFLVTGFLEIQVFMRRAGSTGFSKSYVYLGTDAVSLGTLVAQKHIINTGHLNKSLDRTIIFDGDTLISTSPTLQGYDNNSVTARGDASSNYTIVRNGSFNIASNNFIQIATGNADVSETTTLEGFTIKIYN